MGALTWLPVLEAFGPNALGPGSESRARRQTAVVANAIGAEADLIDAESEMTRAQTLEASGRADTKTDKKSGKKNRVLSDAARACGCAYRCAESGQQENAEAVLSGLDRRKREEIQERNRQTAVLANDRQSLAGTSRGMEASSGHSGQFGGHRGLTPSP